MTIRNLILLSLIFCTGLCHTAFSQNFFERFDDWPVQLKINGAIAVGDSIDEALLKSWVVAQKPSQLVILANRLDKDLSSWADLCGVPIDQFQTATIENVEQVSKGEGTMIFWDESRPRSSIEQSEWDQLNRVLRSLLHKGNLLAAFGNHSRWMSKYYVDSVAQSIPAIAPGMNLLSDCVFECAYDSKGVGTAQLLSILSVHPRSVGVGLESGNILVQRGRKIHLNGEGRAHFLLAANERTPTRIHAITEQRSRTRSPENHLIDLTEWRRDAIDRTLEEFPPRPIEQPVVENGTLFIVGGGGMPEGLMGQFVEAAGGTDKAHLIYVPCEESDQVSESQSIVSLWRRMGVERAEFIHTKDRIQANSDVQLIDRFKNATGIWFGGGRQWNLADSYYGTQVHRMMKEVLARGGAIGGSSAGASIQASYLARATPIENFKIMAPGYERGGLGFIRGVAIDQHFTQRNRQPDMTQLVNRYPQLLGIGIDESTAIIVNKSIARVTGKGKVHFYDRTKPVYPDKPDHVALTAGQAYELIQREIIPEAGK